MLKHHVWSQDGMLRLIRGKKCKKIVINARDGKKFSIKDSGFADILVEGRTVSDIFGCSKIGTNYLTGKTNLYDSAIVITDNAKNSEMDITLHDQSTIVSSGNKIGTISLRDKSVAVVGFKSSFVGATAVATVVAMDHSRVIATKSSIVHAFDDAKVIAFDLATVYLHDQATVVPHGDFVHIIRATAKNKNATPEMIAKT